MWRLLLKLRHKLSKIHITSGFSVPLQSEVEVIDEVIMSFALREVVIGSTMRAAQSDTLLDCLSISPYAGVLEKLFLPSINGAAVDRLLRFCSLKEFGIHTGELVPSLFNVLKKLSSLKRVHIPFMLRIPELLPFPSSASAGKQDSSSNGGKDSERGIALVLRNEYSNDPPAVDQLYLVPMPWWSHLIINRYYSEEEFASLLHSLQQRATHFTVEYSVNTAHLQLLAERTLNITHIRCYYCLTSDLTAMLSNWKSLRTVISKRFSFVKKSRTLAVPAGRFYNTLPDSKYVTMFTAVNAWMEGGVEVFLLQDYAPQVLQIAAPCLPRVRRIVLTGWSTEENLVKCLQCLPQHLRELELHQFQQTQ